MHRMKHAARLMKALNTTQAFFCSMQMKALFAEHNFEELILTEMNENGKIIQVPVSRKATGLHPPANSQEIDFT